MPPTPTIEFPQQRQGDALRLALVLARMLRGGYPRQGRPPAELDRNVQATARPEPEPADDSSAAYADWRTEVMGLVGIRI